MSQSTISTFQLFEMFPDEETARKYLEDRLWPMGAICPQCNSGTRVIVRPNGFYRCNGCKKFTFSIRTGTIFGRSKIPLHKWVYAMYLLVTSRKGVSSMQLAKEIGVTQKSAWFMLQRLREACGNDSDIDKLRGDRVKAPEILDRIADKVLAYHPPNKPLKPKRNRKPKRKA